MYLLYDGHGSVRQITDSDSEVINDFGFDAYGNLLYYTSAPQTALLYTGEYYDSVLRMQYLRNRWTNPSTGRFNRQDEYPGSRTEPLSLHRYIYCNDNPINNIDPSGYMTGTLTETAITVNIGQVIRDAVITGYLVHQLYSLDQSVSQRAAQREIELFVQMQASTGTLTQQQFDELEERVRQKSRSRRKKKLYLHYSFDYHADSLLMNGLFNINQLPPHGSFATRDIYLTGWHAKWFLALPHRYPPNSAYIVLPKRGFGPTSEARVPGDRDILGRWMNGQGYQYTFRWGSGGKGTVFGPIEIPVGQFIW